APLRALDGRTLLVNDGRIWELSPWMPGTADLSRPPPLARLRSGFAALAAFHQSLAHHRAAGTSPGLVRRAQEINSLIRGGFTSLDRAVSHRETDSRAPVARRWLTLAQNFAPAIALPLTATISSTMALQPCLRDVRPQHLLFDGDRLTGLVDF